MKKIILIDGNALIFRAYYATASRMSKNLQGVPTNAIYLFASIILKLIEKKDFDDILVALDSPGKKFRHQEFNDYKANRKEIPIELKSQFAPIKEFLNICHIQTIEIEGYEADDVIGTLISKSKELNIHFEVYTGDRDLLQLIDDEVIINMMHKGLSEVEAFDYNHLKEVYNIKPLQIIDVKALMGDSADNIPGVKGIGEKTAFDLINKYESLNNIYEHIDEIKGKLQEKLIADKKMAYLSYELATILRDLTIDFSILKESYKGIDKKALTKFLKQYDIKSLLKYGEEETIQVQEELAANIVTKISKELLTKDSFIYVDIDNENYHYGHIRGIGIANANKYEYIPIDYISFDFDFIDYLMDEKIKKNVLDSKRCYLALLKMNIKLKGIAFDLLLAAYLLHQDFKNTLDIFNFYNIELQYNEKAQNLEEYAKNALNIAYFGNKIKNQIIKEIQAIDNENLLYNIEQPLALVLAEMEKTGVEVDVNLLHELEKEYSQKIFDLETLIKSMVGYDININSPKQLAELLYDELNLPCNKKRSTGAEDLKAIEKLHPIIPLILSYRKYFKLLNTYIDAFQSYMFEDHRIHAMFNQSTTMTGRLSSSQPNLQNLSVRDDERKIIRKLMIPKKGFKILSLDYSQIELRILAYLANDETMLEAFTNGYDIHSATASKIYSVPIEEVTSMQRRVAKATNFGIVYGISSWGLASQIGVSLNEAKELIEKFFITYPNVKKFLDSSIQFCQENGYVTTLLKRRRTVDEIHSSNYNIKEFGKRVAMNTPIQGSAADIIKVAMIQIDEYLKDKKEQCQLTCQIHDELIFEVQEDKALTFAKDIQNIMENVINDQKITLKVSVSIGNNWLEAK